MKKNHTPLRKCLLPAVFFCCFQAISAEAPFAHFKTSFDKDFPSLQKNVVCKDKFANTTNRWRIDPTFPGVLSCSNNTLRLAPAKRNNKEYGVALKLYRSPHIMDGKKYEFSAKLSGHGKAKIGMIIYGNAPNGRAAQKAFWSEERDLGSCAENFVFDADCSRQKVNHIGLMLYISTGGELICHETELLEISDSSIDIKSPYLLLVKRGDSLPRFNFDVSRTGNIKHPMILLSSNDKNVNSAYPAAADDEGKVCPPTEIINDRTIYTLSVNGSTSTTYVLPISSSCYEYCDALAKKIRLKRPLRIVILGDSLQDKNFVHNVGCGACEQLFFWLDKYNHDLVTIRNLAVRGDSLQRADQRMQRELATSNISVFEQRVYRGMFDSDADVVFIQFGHNDTAFRTLNSEIRGDDGISKENISQPLHEIIKNCRKHWPNARIIVFSSTSSCEDVCRKLHRELSKQNPKRVYNIFGVPERLEKYNMISKATAQASGGFFYDIYSDMKALPDETKAMLFKQADGVHLSQDGHVYMTIKYLELLSDIIEKLQ